MWITPRLAAKPSLVAFLVHRSKPFRKARSRSRQRMSSNTVGLQSSTVEADDFKCEILPALGPWDEPECVRLKGDIWYSNASN